MADGREKTGVSLSLSLSLSLSFCVSLNRRKKRKVGGGRKEGEAELTKQWVAWQEMKGVSGLRKTGVGKRGWRGMSIAVSMVQYSSDMDEFAASLEGLLASTTDTSSCENDMDRIKRRKVEDTGCSTWQLDADRSSEASVKEDTCAHPGCVKGMCVICGRKVDYDTCGDASVALNYIFEGTLLGKNEIARIRNKEWLNLLRCKKLYLLLDLDHTLLHSTQLQDVTPDETNSLRVDMLNNKDISTGKVEIFRLDSMNMLTKLRPFVRTFPKEASKLFEMDI
ncbi:hypothetical protein RHMOL_Rhmol01G0058300 [Rhododendron molle]|uniref:Uncharacterized protein n=1 Tax=Rhododendron molle TaxID=49168 RepID=A0ACC0PZY6_RHOML|nr:hypothetical protein RHMOL_Rhmol01G0058300 [Rhododendron molle]